MNRINLRCRLSWPILALAATAFCGCDDTSDTVVEAPIRWNLTFSDEFNGSAGALPDSSKWVFDQGGFGWGNNELQNYTNRAENASLDGDGNLVITARREAFGDNAFTSARLKTRELFEQEYGLFEARILLPGGPGLWPAFWMLGNDCVGDICQDGEVVWPQVGEIDVVELFGADTRRISTSIHGPGYSAGAAITGKQSLPDGGDFTDDFHVFAVEWDPTLIRWFIDGDLVLSATVNTVLSRQGEWVFDHPFFMLLNLAVGGNPVGAPDGTTVFPAEMRVDYVRVFERRGL